MGISLYFKLCYFGINNFKKINIIYYKKINTLIKIKLFYEFTLIIKEWNVVHEGNVIPE